MPAIWTEDDFTLIEDETTGRHAQMWPSGYLDERGSTGVRDITGLIPSGVITAGRLLIVRDASWVTWILDGLTLDASASGNVAVIPGGTPGLNGFRPRYTLFTPYAVPTLDLVRLGVSDQPSFNIAAAQNAAGVAITAKLAYATGAGWPPSLPGVADGEPIGA